MADPNYNTGPVIRSRLAIMKSRPTNLTVKIPPGSHNFNVQLPSGQSSNSGFGSDSKSGPRPNTPLPALKKGCGVSALTIFELGSIIANYSKIDLSYGSPLHCYLLKRLGKNSEIGALSLQDIEGILPDNISDNIIKQVKQINLTNQRISYALMFEFMISLKQKYPSFNPTSLIIPGNDPIFNDPAITDSFQRSLKLSIITGGRRSRKYRKHRKTRKR